MCKIYLKPGLKDGTTRRVPFLGPHAEFRKEIKEKHVHGPIFGTVWRYQKWDRKIAKSTVWADPSTKQKPYLRFFILTHKSGTEEARTSEA